MITCDPNVCWGHPCIAGTRLRVEDVAGSIRAGETIEQYSADKEITIEQVKEALAVWECLRMLYEALDAVSEPPDDEDECEPEEPDHEE